MNREGLARLAAPGVWSYTPCKLSSVKSSKEPEHGAFPCWHGRAHDRHAAAEANAATPLSLDVRAPTPSRPFARYAELPSGRYADILRPLLGFLDRSTLRYADRTRMIL